LWYFYNLYSSGETGSTNSTCAPHNPLFGLNLKATLLCGTFDDFEHKAAPVLYILNQFTSIGASDPELFDTPKLLLDFVAQLHPAIAILQ
jgi:hypothetical protein